MLLFYLITYVNLLLIYNVYHLSTLSRFLTLFYWDTAICPIFAGFEILIDNYISDVCSPFVWFEYSIMFELFDSMSTFTRLYFYSSYFRLILSMSLIIFTMWTLFIYTNCWCQKQIQSFWFTRFDD